MESISFEHFKSLVIQTTLQHHSDLVPVVICLLKKVQQRHEKSSDYGRFINPGTVLRCDGTDQKQWAKPDLSAIFVSCPYFDTSQMKPPTLPRKSPLHVIRGLIQSHYPQEIASERESGQIFGKFRGVQKNQYLRVPQFWAMVLQSETIITCGPSSLSECFGEDIEFVDEKSLETNSDNASMSSVATTMSAQQDQVSTENSLGPAGDNSNETTDAIPSEPSKVYKDGSSEREEADVTVDEEIEPQIAAKMQTMADSANKYGMTIQSVEEINTKPDVPSSSGMENHTHDDSSREGENATNRKLLELDDLTLKNIIKDAVTEALRRNAEDPEIQKPRQNEIVHHQRISVPPQGQTSATVELPTYFKVHKEHLEIDTLLYFGIPYEINILDPDYIVILREMDITETEVLFDHTRQLKSRVLRGSIRPRKETKHDYAWVRRRKENQRAANRPGHPERRAVEVRPQSRFVSSKAESVSSGITGSSRRRTREPRTEIYDTPPETIVFYAIMILLTRPLIGEHGVEALYQNHLSSLRYDANRRPSKRLLRELHLLEEELEIISSVRAQEHNMLSGLRMVLSDRSYRITNQVRIDSYLDLEKPILEYSQDMKDSTKDEFDVLHERIVGITQVLKYNIEISEEGHSKAILIFTLVTVIFLPLSFVAAFFGMNTSDMRNLENTQVLFWEVASPITVAIGGISLIVAFGGHSIKDKVEAQKEKFGISERSQGDLQLPH